MFKLSFSFFRLAGNNDLVPRGSLVGSSGDMFYITNTHCLMTLSGVNIVNNDADGALLRVVGNSASRGWGTAGNNGTINFNGYTITLADGTVLK